MSGRTMMLKDLVKAYGDALEAFRPIPESAWELRSAALALRAAVGAKVYDPVKDEVTGLATGVSEACDGLYRFENNMIRWMTAKGYTRLATIFDITTIGSLALHDLAQGRWKNPMDLLGAAISEGSMIVASLQYTKAQEENIKAMTEDHISALYGLMWDIVPLLRGALDPDELAESQKGLDGFFKALRSEATTLVTRIVVIILLYLVVIKVKSDRLLEKAKGLDRKK